MPTGMPDICWKTFPPKTTIMLSTRNSRASMLIRGRQFDPEKGGGWQILSGEIIYFHHGLGRKI